MREADGGGGDRMKERETSEATRGEQAVAGFWSKDERKGKSKVSLNAPTSCKNKHINLTQTTPPSLPLPLSLFIY